MAQFPVLTNGVLERYPLTRSMSMRAQVTRFAAGNSQRYPVQTRMEQFQLRWTRLTAVDRDIILNFWNSQKGAFGDFSIQIDGVLYDNCTFLADTLDLTEEAEKLWTLQLNVGQEVPVKVTLGTLGAFPLVGWGVGFDIGCTMNYAYRTIVNANQLTGKRGTAIGRDAFIRSWTLPYGVLLQADVTKLENHFHAACGRWKAFAFKNPLGENIAKAIYGQDDLVINYSGPGTFSTSITIEEAL
jgi:hypothetical protein